MIAVVAHDVGVHKFGDVLQDDNLPFVFGELVHYLGAQVLDCNDLVLLPVEPLVHDSVPPFPDFILQIHIKLISELDDILASQTVLQLPAHSL